MIEKSQKISIIGGSGFVGTNLCQILSDREIPFEIFNMKPCATFPDSFQIADVTQFAQIHIALHNPERRSFAERSVYRFARGGIVLGRDLTEGTVLSSADVWVRRAESGEIPTHQFDAIKVLQITCDLSRNTQLRWVDLE